MTNMYRRIQFDVFHLHVSRSDLRIDAPCIELAILHEMTKELVENIREEVALQSSWEGEIKRRKVGEPRSRPPRHLLVMMRASRRTVCKLLVSRFSVTRVLDKPVCDQKAPAFGG
jgi:hypothetical protein